MIADGMHIDEWGTKSWWVNGKFHRLDGPAVIYANGTKWWYVNGKRHRLDGPAVERADGVKWWYLNNKRYGSFDKWLEAVDVSEQEQIFLKLKWA
jgi:hypothetical protein